jgi:uncharacterized protein YndB with AHSA1/START domain
MSVNRTKIAAPPSLVYDILLDPEAYPSWVVGTRAIRGWDKAWPEIGSCFYHRVGLGPFAINDFSKVLVVDPGHRVTLEIGIRPLGLGVVDMAIEPADNAEATLVTLTETTIGGFLHMIPVPMLHPVLWARNDLTLRRLAVLAEGRQRLAQSKPGEVRVARA